MRWFHGWGLARTYRFGLLITTIYLLGSQVVTAGDKKGSAAEVLEILRNNRFTSVKKVSDLPAKILGAARVIPSGRPLGSIMVDPGRSYQDQHAGIDLSKPTAQLIFGAISERYVLVCYWTGGLTKAEHVTVVERGNSDARLVFDGVIFPEARNLAQVEQRLRTHGYVSFNLSTPSTILP